MRVIMDIFIEGGSTRLHDWRVDADSPHDFFHRVVVPEPYQDGPYPDFHNHRVHEDDDRPNYRGFGPITYGDVRRVL
jgi:hypothetical protein